MSDFLHIPDGIRFDCTGCGNCCLGWPVPITGADHQRISTLNYDELGLARPHFRQLISGDKRLQGYTQTLEKRADGRCAFLTAENRCQLHAEFGETAKPSMCRLFPYTFTQTPSGVYASVSFASSGVLLNSGRLLSEQRQVLEDKWQLFKELYSGWNTDWSKLQLIDGIALDWNDYLSIEVKLTQAISQHRSNVSDVCAALSAILVGELPSGIDPERGPKLEARPKIIDQILLKHLERLLFPEDVFADTTYDLDARQIMTDIVAAPDVVHMNGGKIRFQQIAQTKLNGVSAEIDDLLCRFLYCRLFGKLYFGPGYAHLSLLSGMHHLILLIALLRIKLKIILISNGKVSFFDAVELVRTMERRLTQLSLSPESTSVIEVLSGSPSRVQRVIYLAM